MHSKAFVTVVGDVVGSRLESICFIKGCTLSLAFDSICKWEGEHYNVNRLPLLITYPYGHVQLLV